MDYVAYYEIGAVLLLMTVLMCYIYRNWLELKKNRVFYILTVETLVVVAVDLAGRMCIGGADTEEKLFMATVVATVANLGMLLTSLLLYVYYLAIAGEVRRLHSKAGAVVLLVSLGIAIALVSNPWTHIMFWYDSLQKGHYYRGIGMLFLAICVELYLLAGGEVIWESRSRIPKNHYRVILASNGVLMFAMLLQYIEPMHWRLTCFVLALVLTMYYLLMHMSDQHLMYASRCFSQVGLRRIVEEKAHYRTNFSTLSVNINNISSMMNVCSAEEMEQVHIIIARYMRAVGSQHALYQMHDAEFILMCKDMAKAREICKRLQGDLPKVIRINGKSLPVVYSYYIMQFSDAGYSVGDFYRIIAGLRSLSKDVSDSSEVVYYEGEIKETLQRELTAVWKLNEALESDGFSLKFAPIYDTNTGEVCALDTKMLLDMGDGTYLEDAEIWQIAEENGTSKKVAMRFLDNVLGFVVENYILQRGIERIHINLSTMQMKSKEAIEQYSDILLFHQVYPEQVVFEVFMDQSVPEQIIEDNIRYMRDKGFHVLLDEFGVNICNLKNMLGFSFTMAKINAEMVTRFLEGKREELEHLVRMLQKQKWDIYLDGVDDRVSLKSMRSMGVAAIQGESVTPFMDEAALMEWLRKRGGSEQDESTL